MLKLQFFVFIIYNTYECNNFLYLLYTKYMNIIIFCFKRIK